MVTVGRGSSRSISITSRAESLRSSSSRVAATTRSGNRRCSAPSNLRPRRPPDPVIRIIRLSFSGPTAPSLNQILEADGNARDGRRTAVQVQHVSDPFQVDHQAELLLAHTHEVPVEILDA